MPNFNPYNAAVFSFCSLRNNEGYSYIFIIFRIYYYRQNTHHSTRSSALFLCVQWSFRRSIFNFRVILFPFMSTQLTINNHKEVWILWPFYVLSTNLLCILAIMSELYDSLVGSVVTWLQEEKWPTSKQRTLGHGSAWISLLCHMDVYSANEYALSGSTSDIIFVDWTELFL